MKILCSYRQQGIWKKHQKAVNVNILQDKSTLEAIVRRCEAEVLDFYNSNHEAGGQVVEHEGEQQPAPLMM